MDNLESLYEYYSQVYTLEWGNDTHGFFKLYFSDKKSRQYRIHVYEEGVALERRSRIIKWYWGAVTHIHFDNDDTINDVWEYGVKKLLGKYDDPTQHSMFKRLAQYGYEYSCNEIYLGWKGKLKYSDTYDFEWSASERDGIFVKIKRIDPWRVFFEYSDGGCVIYDDEALGIEMNLRKVQAELDILRKRKDASVKIKYKEMESIIYNNMADWFMDMQSEKIKNMDIFHIVKKYMDEYDFYGLLKGGAPRDEYDSESESIASQIKTGSTEKEIENVISTVMEKSFAVSVDNLPPQSPKNYRDISERIKDEMDRSFCSEEIAKVFLELFPESEEAYRKHMQEYAGLLGHIFYADVINIPMCELYDNSGDEKLIRKYCEFVEQMWRYGNDADRNVVDVTILEQLSDDEDRWQRFGTYISQDFRDYINNELLTENIMMRNVSKLQVDGVC
ncbi:MAG: hypothetical protein K6G27_02840 [Lachnospiraceae bacterium]|nr:hypothetical protein [Lachnospiraceae bacterium]